jgi:hypothetical protein
MTNIYALSIALECVIECIENTTQQKRDFMEHPNFDNFLVDYRTDRINRYDNKIKELRKVLKTLDPLEQKR